MVLGFEIIEKAGLVVKHMLGVVLLCWRRMVRAGLVSWGVGFILIEVVGAIAQKHFWAPVLTTVVALIFAFVLAYSVMVTVLIDELIIGSINMIRVIEGDLQGGVKALAIATERRAGDAGSGIMRWLGHPAAASSTSVPVPVEQTETQADIDATDEFTSTLPRPRVNARPVAADQLPRIGWAMEQLERQDQQAAAPILRSEVDPPEELRETTWHAERGAVPTAEPVGISSTPLATTPSPRTTRPLATSQPLVEGERSIWSRISKTLVGNVHPPLADFPDPTEESTTGDDPPLG